MFDKLKKVISGQVAEMKEISGGPPDPKNVPDVSRVSFGDLDLPMLSAYLGRDVLSIEPMGAIGPRPHRFWVRSFRTSCGRREPADRAWPLVSWRLAWRPPARSGCGPKV